jgi:PilZ domain
MIAWDGIERRRFIRIKLHCTASITDSKGVTISTYAEEVSEKGVKVSIKRELKRLTKVSLEIYLREDPVICQGKVAWVRKIEGEYLEGGVVFDTGIELIGLKEEDKQLIKSLILQKKDDDKQH